MKVGKRKLGRPTTTDISPERAKLRGEKLKTLRKKELKKQRHLSKDERWFDELELPTDISKYEIGNDRKLSDFHLKQIAIYFEIPHEWMKDSVDLNEFHLRIDGKENPSQTDALKNEKSQDPQIPENNKPQEHIPLETQRLLNSEFINAGKERLPQRAINNTQSWASIREPSYSNFDTLTSQKKHKSQRVPPFSNLHQTTYGSVFMKKNIVSINLLDYFLYSMP